MKLAALALFAAAALAWPRAGGQPPAPAPAGDPQPGQSESAALAALGPPLGRAGDARRAVLLYPRGSITIHDGVVAEVRLISPAALAARQAAESAAAEKQAQAAARLEALRQALLADPAYLALSTGDKILALDKFDRAHPGSLIWQDLQALLTTYRAEQLRAAAQARAQAATPAPAPAASPPAPASAPPPAPNFSYATGSYLMAGTFVPYYPNYSGPTVAVNGNAIAITTGSLGFPYGWCGPAGSTVIVIGGQGGQAGPIQAGPVRIYPGPAGP